MLLDQMNTCPNLTGYTLCCCNLAYAAAVDSLVMQLCIERVEDKGRNCSYCYTPGYKHENSGSPEFCQAAMKPFMLVRLVTDRWYAQIPQGASECGWCGPMYAPVQELLGQEEDFRSELAALSCPPLLMGIVCCEVVQGSPAPMISTIDPRSCAWLLFRLYQHSITYNHEACQHESCKHHRVCSNHG